MSRRDDGITSDDPMQGDGDGKSPRPDGKKPTSETPRSGDRGRVSIRDISRTFGPLTAVDRLTFEVDPGELVGVVGPDGAGKTTLLRMLAGVLRPTSGTALLGGVDVADDPEGVKPSIAYMAQRFGLYEDLTVAENLDFYADLYSVPRDVRPERLERLYAFSRLGDFSGRLAGKLSGGMKQKLSLSCCLIHRPDILLLDEPTFGVDPISRRDLWLILHGMVEAGVTVIVSTAYMDEAERCDRVVMLDGGRAIAMDEPARLQASLDGTMVALRSGDTRRTRDALVAREEIRGATLFGDSVHALLAPGREPEEVGRALAETGLDVTDLRAIEPSLEDIFIRLVADDG